MSSKVSMLFYIVALSLQHTTAKPDKSDNCHPQPSKDTDHYIIGYGSLINGESKNKTSSDTGVNVPVKVLGFKRTWSCRGYSNASLSTTYLGVEKQSENYLNGVVFSIPNYEAVQKYDQRERYYCRVKVPFENITVLRGNISDNGVFPTEDELKKAEFWIYITKPEFYSFPDEQYPIVQSYVDIFLSGCIQMERKYGLKNYSDDCVTKTYGWEYSWANDRIHPRRPFAYQSEAGAVDRLIGKYVPDYSSRTYIERIYVVSRRNDGSPVSVVTPFMIFSASFATLFAWN